MTKNETNFVIIPVKKTDKAKSRLSKYLPDEKRKQFCLAMFEDVIKTVKSTDRVQEVIVVSNDHLVPQLVEKFGAVLLLEKTHGLNGTISKAINLCIEMGATSILVLPADIPLITVEDLEEIYSLGERASMVIAPSRDGRGTNALLLKPPNISPTFYGPFSFQKHIQKATKLGIKFLCYSSLEIALDIDTINDLEYFVSLKPKHTVAYNALEKAGLTNIFETSL